MEPNPGLDAKAKLCKPVEREKKGLKITLSRTFLLCSSLSKAQGSAGSRHQLPPGVNPGDEGAGGSRAAPRLSPQVHEHPFPSALT